jgi:hypothetical protein
VIIQRKAGLLKRRTDFWTTFLSDMRPYRGLARGDGVLGDTGADSGAPTVEATRRGPLP